MTTIKNESSQCLLENPPFFPTGEWETVCFSMKVSWVTWKTAAAEELILNFYSNTIVLIGGCCFSTAEVWKKFFIKKKREQVIFSFAQMAVKASMYRALSHKSFLGGVTRSICDRSFDFTESCCGRDRFIILLPLMLLQKSWSFNGYTCLSIIKIRCLIHHDKQARV